MAQYFNIRLAFFYLSIMLDDTDLIIETVVLIFLQCG